MERGRAPIAVVAAFSVALIASVGSGQAGAATAGGIEDLPAWGTEPAPNGGFPANRLQAVSAVSSTDAWAVGSFGLGATITPMAQRWDGTSWSSVPLPPLGAGELFGVAAVASDDVWMVGGFNSGGDALILHWDGTQITEVPHPNPGTFNRLYAVAAVAADDVWAVGEFTNPISRTLALHWNGASWKKVPSPNGTDGYNQLLGVTAIASDDVWAVGEDGSNTLALHWDGSSWIKVPSPTPGGIASFRAVSAASSRSVWAVGDGGAGTLTARWNGRRWRVVPSPDPGAFFQELNGVAALGPNDVWAVGFYDVAGDWRTLAMHWDGSTWTVVDAPSPDNAMNVLYGAAEAGSGRVWAVGEGDGTLALRWNGSTWKQVPTENEGTGTNELRALSIAAPDDIWAVGHAQFDSLTLHYDGSEWSIVPSPSPPAGVVLEDVVAIAPDDVWAVGTSGVEGLLDTTGVAMHWDGDDWTIVPTPQPGGSSVDELHAVDAVGPDNLWAVGTYWDAQTDQHATILHWDGDGWTRVQAPCDPFGGLTGITLLSATDGWAVGNAATCRFNGSTWAIVPSPQPRIALNEIGYPLEDVSAAAPADVWAVGARVIENPKFLTFIGFAERWNGTSWKRVTLVPGQFLYGVEAVSSNDVWAVGTSGFGPIIAHYDGSSWSRVPTPEAGEGGALRGLDASGPLDLWAAGNTFPGQAGSRNLIEHAPSDTQGAVIGEANVGFATITWIGPEEGSTSTDPFGAYDIGGLLAGVYTFVASEPGCDPDVAQVQVVAGETVVQDFQLSC